MRRPVIVLMVLMIFFSYHLTAQTAKILDSVMISGQWFLAYRHLNYANELPQDLFTLKRGYITFKKELNKTFTARFTQDITLDTEGDDAGNLEMRLKYCYLKISPFKTHPLLKDSWLELGLVHRPWVDFEQSINTFRVQGKLFVERYDIINSADFGFTYVNLLGGKLDKENRYERLRSLPGKYGSLAIGLYNGGGYHAIEYNRNKTFESRLTLRPFYKKLPGLQISHNFVIGKGNTPAAPDFYMQGVMLSYESVFFQLMAQSFTANGNFQGTFVDSTGKSYQSGGYSLFGEIFIPKTKFSLFGRYDHYGKKHNTHIIRKRMIGGLTYYFYRKNKLLFDIDSFDDGTSLHRTFEIALEILF